MAIEVLSFEKMQSTFLEAIPEAKDVLITPSPNLINKDVVLDEAILKVLPFIRDVKDNAGNIDIDATIRNYSDHVREQSVKLLDVLERNIANLDETNTNHVTALKNLFQLKKRTLITASSPGILIDPNASNDSSAQETMVVIELAFIAAFGSSFDIGKYVSSFTQNKIIETFTQEYINIIPREGAQGLIHGDLGTVSDAVKTHLETVQLQLGWTGDELIAYIEHLQNINKYIDGYVFIQMASNEGFTDDTLNNPLSTAWMYTSLDLDLHIEAIKGGTW